MLEFVEKVTVFANRIEILFAKAEEPVIVEAELIRSGNEVRIDAPSKDWPETRSEASLIKLIVRAHQARKALEDPSNMSLDEAASSMDLSKQYFCRLLRLGYLAPDITASILDGKQPAHINRQFLARGNNLPLDWEGQRKMLGFG